MDGRKLPASRFSLPLLLLVLVIASMITVAARAEIVAPGETAKITDAPLAPVVAGPVLATTRPAAKTPAAETEKPAAAETPTPEAPAEKPFTTPIEQTAIRKSKPVKETDAAATPAPAPASSSMLPAGVTQTLQVAAALAVVLGLIFIGKAAAKKYLPQAKTATGKNVIEVLARHALSKNQSLVLVRIGSQIVALNQGKEASQSVLVISEPTEVAKIIAQIDGQNPNSIQSGFNRLLANARMDLEDPANDPDREELNLRELEPDALDSQLEEMAAAKRQLMELRQQVRSVRDSLGRD
ncbi:MAG: flagellar biosynthetic protein FliO [Phycisphaerae bacterium]